MFTPRQPVTAKAHKQRRWRASAARLWAPSTLAAWPRVIAVGAGHMPLLFLERLYTRTRRLCPTLTTLRRFWINLQGVSVLTRKPENVRMGKGKGSRAGVQVRINPGVTLVAFSAVRRGTLHAFYRRLRVRCRFPIGVQYPGSSGVGGFVGQPASWVRLRRIQPRYITPQFTEFRETLRRLRRPALLGYFLRLF